MANRSEKKILASLLTTLFFIIAVNAFSSETLRQGMNGSEVTQIQESLKILGYFTSEPTGYFGRETEAAVTAFQQDNGLEPDGIVGSETMKLIREKKDEYQARTYTVGDGETLEQVALKFSISAETLARFNHLEPDSQLSAGQTLRIPTAMPVNANRDRSGIELTPWEEVDTLFPVGMIARVTDLETGRTFKVYRHGGHFHSDSEPLTAEDTAIMYGIYNNQWSWSRRALIFEFGSHRIAASMNGKPHGRDDIKNNNFDGHFCIHFYGSRLHKNHRVDPEHQEKIMEAFSWFRSTSGRG